MGAKNRTTITESKNNENQQKENIVFQADTLAYSLSEASLWVKVSLVWLINEMNKTFYA